MKVSVKFSVVKEALSSFNCACTTMTNTPSQVKLHFYLIQNPTEEKREEVAMVSRSVKSKITHRAEKQPL